MANIQNGDQTTRQTKRLIFGAAIAAALAVAGYAIWLRPGAESAPQGASIQEAPRQAGEPEISAPVSAGLAELLVDVFRSDADGATLIAGTAAPGSTIKIALDGAPLSKAAAENGEFVAQFEIEPNGQERLIELAAYDATGQQLTEMRSFIVAPRSVQIAALSAPTDPAAPDQTAPDPTAPPSAQTGAPEPAQASAPDVLVASSEGIRVLQSGDGPDVQAQVVIDTITYDPAGEVALAGRAPANGSVRVYINNAPIKTAKIAPDGQWKIPLPEIDAGVYTLRVDELGADGRVASRTETPFQREDPAALASLAAAQNQSAERAGEEGTKPRTGPKVSRVTVQPGNTLWGLASETYGDGMLFVRLFEANKETIRNPDLIYPGQVFALPEN